MSKIKAVTKAGFPILRSLIVVAIFVAWCLPVFGQPANEKVQMADGLRRSGKIYVVVAVLLTVLAGLIIYVISLDRKISKMEKEPPAENIH